MSTSAQLFKDPQPRYGEGAMKYSIDCKWSQTVLWHLPGGPLDLPERHLISVLLQRHEEECSRCNTARLWRKHGDLELKAAVDGLWEQMGLSTLAERRN